MYKFDKSEKMFERLSRVLAGGVGSQVRSAAKPVIFFTHGKGNKLYDVNGNEYIDYLLGYGPAILGYAHPVMVDAIIERAKKGTQFGSEVEETIKLCEKLVKIIPCADMVKLNSTGSEAVHSSMRVARAFTGRNKIIKFEGHYHGCLDNIYVSHLPGDLHIMGSENAPRPLLESAGQVKSVLEDLIVLPWNNLDIVEKTIKERHFEIAAVITEPIMSNCGLIMPKRSYLKGLREITKKYGILLIFDEVITGFRIALGGAQEYFDITPDLSVFAKGVGGGIPIGGYGGRKDIMEFVAKKKCVEAGTYNTNPLSVACTLAVVTYLEKNREKFYIHLTSYGKKLSQEMKRLADKYGIPFRVEGPGPMFGVGFRDFDIFDLRDALKPHPDLYPEFRRMLLEMGIHIFPTEKGEFYISGSHTEEDLNKTLNAVEYTFKKLR